MHLFAQTLLNTMTVIVELFVANKQIMVWISVICGSVDDKGVLKSVNQKAYQNAFQLFHCTFLVLFLHCCHCNCCWHRLLWIRNKEKLHYIFKSQNIFTKNMGVGYYFVY